MRDINGNSRSYCPAAEDWSGLEWAEIQITHTEVQVGRNGSNKDTQRDKDKSRCAFNTPTLHNRQQIKLQLAGCSKTAQLLIRDMSGVGG